MLLLGWVRGSNRRSARAGARQQASTAAAPALSFLSVFVLHASLLFWVGPGGLSPNSAAAEWIEAPPGFCSTYPTTFECTPAGNPPNISYAGRIVGETGVGAAVRPPTVLLPASMSSKVSVLSLPLATIPLCQSSPILLVVDARARSRRADDAQQQQQHRLGAVLPIPNPICMLTRAILMMNLHLPFFEHRSLPLGGTGGSIRRIRTRARF